MNLFNRHCRFMTQALPVVFASIIIIIIIPAYAGADDSPGGIEGEKKESITNVSRSNLMILPAAGIFMGSGLFRENESGYYLLSRRGLDLDLIRYGNILLSMYATEFIYYRERDSGYRGPDMIRYEMDFGSLGWIFPAGVLSWYFDHICNNMINMNRTIPLQLRWYGTGVRWETHGMRTGRKGRGINFSGTGNFDWLLDVNFRISAARSYSTRSFNYLYFSDFLLRLDLFRFMNTVPYLESGVTFFIHENTVTDRRAEGGIRFHFDNADISPYINYKYRNDLNKISNAGTNLYSMGLKFEALLADEGMPKPGRKNDNEKGTVLFPEIHFIAGYGKYIKNSRLNFNTDFLIDIGLIDIPIAMPFVRSRLIHNSLLENAGMFPRYMFYYHEAGITSRPGLFDSSVEATFRYNRNDESNFYNGYSEKYNLVTFRFLSSGMKTGYRGRSLNFINDGKVRLANSWNWSLSIGKIVSENYYHYSWENELSIRWDIMSYMNSITFLSGTVRQNVSEKSSYVFTGETGMMFKFSVEFTVYYQFRRVTREDRGNGIYEMHHMVGFRGEI